MFNTLLINPLFNLLVTIYGLIPGHDFGVAVIILTIIVRLIIWPLVTKQLHSQRAMQALGPEIAKLKKAAKGDKQKESAMLLELYKEKGINPLASLVPLFIQLPLLFALFFVLRDVLKTGEIAHLTYPFVKNLGGVKEVIADSHVFKASLLGLIDLAKPSLVLAVLAGAAQLIQTKQIMPKKTEGDSTAQMTATTMIIFPVITFLFALRLPAALALYWTVTSVVAIFQQFLIFRRDVTEMEEQK